MDKCEVCGWYDGHHFGHYVWSTIFKSWRGDAYIEKLVNGESYEGELEFLRGRYEPALAHETELGNQV